MSISRRLLTAAVSAAAVIAGRPLLSAPASSGAVVLVDDDAPPGGDGLSWETPFRFLQDALDHAAEGGGAEIRVAGGTYQPDRSEADPDGTGDRLATFALLSGVAVRGGFAGFGAPDPDLRDIELFETVLSGDLAGNDGPDFANYGENSIHVLSSIEVDNTAVLDGVTITAANADGGPLSPPSPPGAASAPGDGLLVVPAEGALGGMSPFDGGGLINVDGSPTLLACTFSANSVEDDGGGMATDGSGIPTLDGCTFIGNRAGIDNAAANGGGLIVAGAGVTVLNSQFLSNVATNTGGGVTIIGPAAVTISNCTFLENEATGPSGGASGGGALIVFNADPLVVNCTFANNAVTNEPEAFAVGGAVHFSGEFLPTLINCVFTANTAQDLGGALCTQDSSHLAVFNCSFMGNSAGAEGGVYFNNNTTPAFVNCLFTGNTAVSGGVATTAGGNHAFTNCTFTGNTAESGGAIQNAGQFGFGTATLSNCILYGNSPDEIVDDPQDPSSVEYSDVLGGFPGVGNIDADPLFVDPDNGNFRLQTGSPCIDAGDNTAVPEGIDTDLDGNPRFVDDPDTPDSGNGDPPIVDMGAYESQGMPCPWDLDGDGTVGVADLLLLIAGFGPCKDCPADFNGDGVVNAADLVELIGNFGPCPGVPCIWDVNVDGVVDQADVAQVVQNLGPCDGCPEDVNGDGVVNGQDVAAVATHIGPCP